jgi:hypothetical protein
MEIRETLALVDLDLSFGDRGMGGRPCRTLVAR